MLLLIDKLTFLLKELKMNKLVLKVLSKYSLLLFLTLSVQVSFAAVNPRHDHEKKYYSVCLDSMQTFVENDGWWVLMKNNVMGWEQVECDPEKYVPEVFQKYLPEKEINQNMKVKEISRYELWIFIPKVK
jgi:hypothetical protein